MQCMGCRALRQNQCMHSASYLEPHFADDSDLDDNDDDDADDENMMMRMMKRMLIMRI